MIFFRCARRRKKLAVSVNSGASCGAVFSFAGKAAVDVAADDDGDDVGVADFVSESAAAGGGVGGSSGACAAGDGGGDPCSGNGEDDEDEDVLDDAAGKESVTALDIISSIADSSANFITCKAASSSPRSFFQKSKNSLFNAGIATT